MKFPESSLEIEGPDGSRVVWEGRGVDRAGIAHKQVGCIPQFWVPMSCCGGKSIKIWSAIDSGKEGHLSRMELKAVMINIHQGDGFCGPVMRRLVGLGVSELRPWTPSDSVSEEEEEPVTPPTLLCLLDWGKARKSATAAPTGPSDDRSVSAVGPKRLVTFREDR